MVTRVVLRFEIEISLFLFLYKLDLQQSLNLTSPGRKLFAGVF
jgi:hypothetical protein